MPWGGVDDFNDSTKDQGDPSFIIGPALLESMPMNLAAVAYCSGVEAFCRHAPFDGLCNWPAHPSQVQINRAKAR
jgi:hypothetical protein